MAVQHPRITVTTAAVELTAATDGDYVPGQSLLFTAPASASVLFIGGPGVTSADGVPLTAGQVVTARLGAGERLFACVDTGSVVLPVLRTGV